MNANVNRYRGSSLVGGLHTWLTRRVRMRSNCFFLKRNSPGDDLLEYDRTHHVLRIQRRQRTPERSPPRYEEVQDFPLQAHREVRYFVDFQLSSFAAGRDEDSQIHQVRPKGAWQSAITSCTTSKDCTHMITGEPGTEACNLLTKR